MTKHLSILRALFFAMLTAACASETTPAITATTSATIDPLPTVAVIEPTAMILTAVPATAVPATATPIIQSAPDNNIMTVDDDGNTAVDVTALDSALNEIDTTALSDDEVNNLLYMREEEKLAHDVYLTLYAQWGLPLFQNIANSESTHTEAIRTLLIRYDLEDPALDQAVGVFTNTFLQDLYDQLVAQGSQSLIAALQVGATIEDLDIVDLETAVFQTDNPDIILVFESLMKGSRNHLRSFISTLQKQNGAYQPQYLDQAAYEAIINSPRERGK